MCQWVGSFLTQTSKKLKKMKFHEIMEIANLESDPHYPNNAWKDQSQEKGKIKEGKKPNCKEN